MVGWDSEAGGSSGHRAGLFRLRLCRGVTGGAGVSQYQHLWVPPLGLARLCREGLPGLLPRGRMWKGVQRAAGACATRFSMDVVPYPWFRGWRPHAGKVGRGAGVSTLPWPSPRPP